MNYTELNRIIEESGMKKAYIASRLGMTPGTLSGRLNGKTLWKGNEIAAFSTLFRLTSKQRQDIFLL